MSDRVFSHLLNTVADAFGSETPKPIFVIEENADSQAVPASSGAIDGSGALNEPINPINGGNAGHLNTNNSNVSSPNSSPNRSENLSGHADGGYQPYAHPEAHQPKSPISDQTPTIAEYYGVEHPLAVFITPNYRKELPSNAILGEVGFMQGLAGLLNPDGTPAFEIARWIPNGPVDLEGRLIKIDPLDGPPRNNRGLIDGIGVGGQELNIRDEIDRVVLVVVRFPISEGQFAQIHTVFCTYGRPKLIADFSNAGLYMDMKYGPSRHERENFGTNAITKPYSVGVLSQFDVVRVPNQKLATMIERDLKGVA